MRILGTLIAMCEFSRVAEEPFAARARDEKIRRWPEKEVTTWLRAAGRYGICAEAEHGLA